jgi:hypothetical protein
LPARIPLSHALLPGWTIEIEGEQRSLYVERRVEGHEPELLRIDGMRITAKAVIRVGEIQMQARRLAELDVNYVFGEGLIGDREALIVVTGGESGGKLSIEFEKESKAAQGQVQLQPRPVLRAGLSREVQPGPRLVPQAWSGVGTRLQ